MRLNDIAAMPTPGRQADTRQAKPAPDGERGFGDLLEAEISGIMGTDPEGDEITTADRSGVRSELDMPKIDLKTQEHRSIDPEDRERSKAVRMIDRMSIDWLSLRMPGRDTVENLEETETAAEIVPAEETEIVAPPVVAGELQDDDGANADRQLAAVQPTRGARAIDENAGRTATGNEARSTDAAQNTRTMRDEAVPAQNSATAQTLEPQETSAGTADDKRPTARMQATVERLDERPDTGVARLSSTQIGSVSVQTVPAPSMELQTPARTVLAALSEHAPEMARPVAQTSVQPQSTEPMRILRIQLHPLELGMVTAKLSLQGGAMAVELQAETRDAAARLATDSNDIVKALRGLGIEVDRVTVTQSSSPTAQQPDQQAGNFERNERFADEAANREGAREQGKGHARGGGGHGAEGDVQPTPDRRGVFI